MKTQILLLVGLLLNKEIALLRNRDISSDCHMVGSLNTTPRLWSCWSSARCLRPLPAVSSPLRPPGWTADGSRAEFRAVGAPSLGWALVVLCSGAALKMPAR